MQPTRSTNAYVLSIFGYLLYLVLLPLVLAGITPCIRTIIGASFSYRDCNTVLVLDRFVMLALGGAIIATVVSFYLDTKRSYRSLLVVVVIFSSATISAYYLYAPRAERSIKRAPILLESLR